jgi:hypothetical protein
MIKSKICSNCIHANYSGSIYGYAESKNTTPQNLNIIFCYEDKVRDFKKKGHFCSKFEDRGSKLLN